MKVLIISAEVWKNNTNGGNVLSNLFEGMDAEFAQIYCNPGIPQNFVCKKYYQMTDFMMINNLIKGRQVGQKLNYDEYPIDEKCDLSEGENKGFYRFFKRYHWQFFDLIREIIWKFARWDNKELDNFILGFKPDIIFAPCYPSHYMLRITRYVAKMTGVKVVSYISDDNYSLKQLHFSPFYWINRIILRKNMKRTFPFYSLTYTMTEEQLIELTKALNAKMKILRKGGQFQGEATKVKVNSPIRIVYAGSIYAGRWKTLAKMGAALKIINENETKIRLDIYTQTGITSKLNRLLNDKKNIFLHKPVSLHKLTEIYKASDIALHVESFDLKYRLLTRLSFSTKIVDCLASSCAVMAISWKEHSGLKYLQKENAAICIDDISKIKFTLQEIVDKPEIIISYAYKAWDCGKRNHKINMIKNDLYNDLKHLANISN